MKKKAKKHTKTHTYKKIGMVLQLMMKLKNSKSIVFSQWQEILNVVGQGLEQLGIPCINPSNKMFSKHKGYKKNGSSDGFHEELQIFKKNECFNVLLLPINKGSHGLNLIEAKNVIMIEPSLNASIFVQAVGRVHRIGQTQETNVYRFIIRESIEEKIIAYMLHKEQQMHLFSHISCKLKEGINLKLKDVLLLSDLTNKVQTQTKTKTQSQTQNQTQTQSVNSQKNHTNENNSHSTKNLKQKQQLLQGSQNTNNKINTIHSIDTKQQNQTKNNVTDINNMTTIINNDKIEKLMSENNSISVRKDDIAISNNEKNVKLSKTMITRQNENMKGIRLGGDTKITAELRLAKLEANMMANKKNNSIVSVTSKQQQQQQQQQAKDESSGNGKENEN